MTPRFQDPDNREAQLRNQENYKVLIYHTELPIMDEYSLVHDEAEARLFSIESGLEESIEHAAKLIELSPSMPVSDIDTHAGVFVYPGLKEEHPAPGAYSVNGFLKHRDEIMERAKGRFEFLNSVAGKYGLKLTLENEPLVNFEPSKAFGGQPKLIYKPLSTPEALKYISGGIQTFDINHFGATKNAMERMKMNDINTREFFEVMRVDSWAEYSEKFMNSSLYFPKSTTAIHVSNTQGIGVHLKDAQDRKNWGADGTMDGIISRKEMTTAMNLARQRRIPVAIEVDYNLTKKDFKEADDFLNYVFE